MNEHDHQVEIFRWAALHETLEPRLKLLYAIPNGGLRHKATAARLKAEGVKAGVPDICLPVSGGKISGGKITKVYIDEKVVKEVNHDEEYNALYIELKKPGCKGPTILQNQWIGILRENLNKVEVCYGYQEAIEVIKKYLGMR